MTFVDLEPAAQRMAELVRGVPDEMLDAPTPNPGYSLGDLLDHVGGLALAFTGAAHKEMGDATSRGPSGDASRLGETGESEFRAIWLGWRRPGATPRRGTE